MLFRSFKKSVLISIIDTFGDGKTYETPRCKFRKQFAWGSLTCESENIQVPDIFKKEVTEITLSELPLIKYL